jgi:arylsulfatase A-like enzyme
VTNLLLITADQFRWDAIAAHGDAALATPNLDRLAASGTSFRRAYSESPVCVPARAALLTGKLPHQTGVFDNDTPLPQGTPTFVRELREAGYQTQAIGKMHFQPPRADHGFERLWLSEELPRSPGEDEYLRFLLDAGYGYVEEPHGIRHELYYVPQVSQLPEHLHTTAWTGQRTIDFLERRHEGRFFCWTSFIKPHPPFDPPAPWYRRYDPLAMRHPVRLPEELARLDHHAKVQHRFKWTVPEQDAQVLRAYYYACVSFVDAWVGRILDALERLGLAEDTLVLFTADHGEYLGDHHRFGKRGFHDAAARVPFLLSWPGRVPAGEERHDLVGLTDVAPTLLAAAGLPAAGRNLLAPGLPRRDVLVGQFSRGATGLYLAMDDQYKYVYSAADDRESLLRVGTLLDECQDHAGDPGLTGRRDSLRRRLLDRFARDGYREPLGEDGWRRFSPPPPPSIEDRGLQFARWRP